MRTRLRALAVALFLAVLPFVGPTGIPEIIRRLPEILAVLQPGEMTVPLGFLAAVALLPIAIWAILAYAVSFNLDALMLRVTLQADAIEYRGFCKRRRLAYADIAGLETRTFLRLWPQLIIWPNQAGLKNIVIPALFERDAAFEAWIGQWPDYKAVKRAADAEEDEGMEWLTISDPDVGQKRYDRARRLVDLPLVIGVIAAIATLFLSPPLSSIAAFILIAPPWLVAAMNIYATGTLRLVLYQPRIYNSSNTMVLLSCCAVALELRAGLDHDFIDITQVLVPAGLCLTGLILAFYFAERRFFRAPLPLAMFLLAAVPYAEGAMLQLNAHLETAPAEIYGTVVLDKEVSTSTSRRRMRKMEYWYLQVEAWGPITAAKKIEVSRSFFDSVAVGDRVCMFLHSGALGVQYFSLATCPFPAPAQASPFLLPLNPS